MTSPRSDGFHGSVPLVFRPESPHTSDTSSVSAPLPPIIILSLPMSWYCWNMWVLGNHCSGSLGTSRLTHSATPPANRPANAARMTYFAGELRKLKYRT